MGLIGSDSAREHAAQGDLEQADADADIEIEVDYATELAAASADADEPESETEWLEALQNSNNTGDLFDWFFREQARRAFLARGN